MADGALTPDVAVRYLEELSTDITAVAVLDSSGSLAACSHEDAEAERIGELVGKLFEFAGADSAQVEVAAGEGCVFAVREGDWTVACVTGRFALPSLVLYDLRNVASDLGRKAA